jgi:hypothetical protein
MRADADKPIGFMLGRGKERRVMKFAELTNRFSIVPVCLPGYVEVEATRVLTNRGHIQHIWMHRLAVPDVARAAEDFWILWVDGNILRPACTLDV